MSSLDAAFQRLGRVTTVLLAPRLAAEAAMDLDEEGEARVAADVDRLAVLLAKAG